jgi:hypothetical protein
MGHSIWHNSLTQQKLKDIVQKIIKDDVNTFEYNLPHNFMSEV